MMIIKQDILKTLLIIWFVAATGYVAYDVYDNYKIKGMQQAYQNGYVAAVDDLIKKTEENGCQPFEVTKDKEIVQIVNADCLPKSDQQIPVQQKIEK